MSSMPLPARAPESRMRKSTRRAAALAMEMIAEDKMAPAAACREAGISLRTLERYRESFVVEAARPTRPAPTNNALTLFTAEQAQVLGDMQQRIARLDTELSELLDLIVSQAASVAQALRNRKMLRDYEAAEEAAPKAVSRT